MLEFGHYWRRTDTKGRFVVVRLGQTDDGEMVAFELSPSAARTFADQLNRAADEAEGDA